MKALLVGQQFKKINSVKEHCHACYEIIITTDGDGQIFIEEEAFAIQKDSVIVLPPMTKHSNTSANGFSDLSIRDDYLPSIQDKRN